MGVLDRLEELLGRPLSELGQSADTDALLTQALHRLEKDADAARARRHALSEEATLKAGFHALRTQEAERLLHRARMARDEGLTDEAARLEAAATKASHGAEALAAEARQAKEDAAALEGALTGLTDVLSELRTRHAAVREHLKTARGEGARAHVHGPPPPHAAPPSADAGPPPWEHHDPDERKARVDAAFDRMEKESGVDDALAALKERMKTRK